MKNPVISRRAKMIEAAVRRDIALDILTGEIAKEIERLRYGRIDGEMVAIDWETGTWVRQEADILPFKRGPSCTR